MHNRRGPASPTSIQIRRYHAVAPSYSYQYHRTVKNETAGATDNHNSSQPAELQHPSTRD